MARKKVIEIVLDTETTGLDFTRERLVEFAAVRLEKIPVGIGIVFSAESGKIEITGGFIAGHRIAESVTLAEAEPDEEKQTFQGAF